MKIRIPALILAAGVTFATASIFAQDQTPASGAVTPDQRINAAVMDRIANDSRLDGRVGVETQDSIVTLTGRVLDPNQLDWIEQDARTVDGVIDVTNLVRTSVGEF